MPELFVCEKCFRDENIREFIENNGSRGSCSFCERSFLPRKTKFACAVGNVAEYIYECLEVEWVEVHPDVLPYDKEEDEYVGTVYSTLELLQEVGDLAETDFAVLEALEPFSPYMQWCSRDGLRESQSSEFWYTWEHFKNIVMHRSRFYFGRIELGHEETNMNETYGDISKIVSFAIGYVLKLGLVRTIMTDEKLYRARKFRGQAPDKIEVKHLTPPPLEVCSKQSNRMSPAGIPMFYGAFDEKTAVKEVRGRKNGQTYVAIFTPVSPLRVLDLTGLPKVPSIFDQQNNGNIELLIFLNSFARDLSRPIECDGREHTEYVPTQVMTEYVRYFAIDGFGHLDGLMYRSAVNRGGKSCVIFADQANCLESADEDIIQILAINQIYKFQ